MNTPLRIVLTCVLALAWVSQAAARPNIVLIMSDDMGYSDIGCYGGEIRTPRLDRLAADGLRFTQFYNTGRCCPTRASLLTGLYPHQAGIGHMTGESRGADGELLPHYRGDLSRNAVTIAEALRSYGYLNYMVGKWHVTRFNSNKGPRFNWPLQRGFDRFYGTIKGAGSFYDPTTLCRGDVFITPDNDPHYKPETYYYTDAISDNAVMFLRDHHREQRGRPFFMYVAYTAAHWPMHALPEDIEKYKGVYDAGYQATRDARLKRMRAMGLIDPGWAMTATVGDWNSVKHKAWELRNMEVYAAMVDRMDQGIGKIVDELRRQGQLDNTLILFLQDNGGCAENMGRSKPRKPYPQYKPMKPDQLQPSVWPSMQTRDGRPVRTGPDVMPGPADTYIAYGRSWANVSNTPFREYKHWVHEGGVATPLIAHWPGGIAPKVRGKLDHQPGHLVDLMATCLDLAEARYPAQYDGRTIVPMQGVSLTPAFRGEALGRTQPIFWEHEGNRAVRDGRWKLVAKGVKGKWELYDMHADRTETHDLAGEHPQVRDRLAERWERWAERAGVKPYPARGPWQPKAKRAPPHTE